MPNLENHKSANVQRILLVGDPGCLIGSTEVTVTRGAHKGRVYDLKTLYHQFNGIPLANHRPWDATLTTDILSLRKNNVIARNRVAAVLYSGVKPVRTIELADRAIGASRDHKFLLPDGQWVESLYLAPGQEIMVRKTDFNNNGRTVKRDSMSVVRVASQGLCFSNGIPLNWWYRVFKS